MRDVRLQLETLDRRVAEGLADVAMPLLRVSLGIIYLWFGALKVAGMSPVADFVGQTIPFLPKRLVVRAIGVWEVAIGIALLLRIALRPTLFLFVIQLAGTFLTFIMQPRRMIQQHNPLLLTTEGEFVIKNIVLLAAGLAVGTTLRRSNEALPATDAELHK